jgi:hypothetical protein
VHTTYCADDMPDFDRWKTLAHDIRMALKYMHFDCLGEEDEFRVLLRVDPTPMGQEDPLTHGPASSEEPTEEPTVHIVPTLDPTEDLAETCIVSVSSGLKFFFSDCEASSPDENRQELVEPTTRLGSFLDRC